MNESHPSPSSVTGELPKDPEKQIDSIMGELAEEIMEKTRYREDASGRNGAVRLLLKRADQRRADKRFDLLEAKMKLGEEVLGNKVLSPEEIQQQMRQIFGLP